MIRKISLFAMFLTLISFYTTAQSITYSEPDRNDLRQTEFDIIGKVKNNIVAVKKIWLPQVIMADDFDAAWNQYMEEYNACNPQIYFDYLQQKVNEN